MAESTIDKIKDITVERQIRKLAGIIDEQNQKIDASVDYSTDINNLKDSDANQTTQINNLKSDVAKNTTAIENLNNRVTTVEQDITNSESEITSVKSAITNIQSKDVAQDVILSTHSEQIQGITESLIRDVQILDGTTTGEIKVRIDRESAAVIDSNSYNLGLPVSAEIIQGTGPSMFKVQITMSSGVKVISNDFVFTTEAIGTDVYISSFTFKAGNQDGYLSADIGLNNGVTIEANNFLVPTDPNVISNITDLQNRVTNIENLDISSRVDAIELKNTEQDAKISSIETKNTEQDTKINSLETKNTSQDTAIQKNATDINSLNSEVSGVMSDLSTKADLNNSSQTIIAGTIKSDNITNAAGKHVAIAENVTTALQAKVDRIQGTQYEGKVLGINNSGVVTPVDIPSGGEVWELVDLNNFPTDWVETDRVKVDFACGITLPSGSPSSWSTAPSTPSVGFGYHSRIIEFELSYYGGGCNTIITVLSSTTNVRYLTVEHKSYTDWNNGNYFIVGSHVFNGGGLKEQSNFAVNRTNRNEYINKMWRLKK